MGEGFRYSACPEHVVHHPDMGCRGLRASNLTRPQGLKNLWPDPGASQELPCSCCSWQLGAAVVLGIGKRRRGMARSAFAPAAPGLCQAELSSAKPLRAQSSTRRVILDDFTYKAVLQSQAVWKSRTSRARHTELAGDFGGSQVSWWNSTPSRSAILGVLISTCRKTRPLYETTTARCDGLHSKGLERHRPLEKYHA